MTEWDNGGSTWEQKVQATERLSAATEIYENVTTIGDRFESGDLHDSDLSTLDGDLDGIEAELDALLAAPDADEPTTLDVNDQSMTPTDMTTTNAVSHMKPL